MQSKNKITPSLTSLVAVSNYKNSEVVRYYGNMNINVAAKSNSRSVGRLSQKDEDKVRLCICNLFIGTSMYFDNVLTQEKADVIATEILAKYEYRQLRLEDLVAICIEIKESDSYKLTPARILRHISDYVKRKEKIVISNAINNSQNHKSDLGESDIDKRLHNSIRHLDRTNQEVVKGRVNIKKFYK
ncbi:hypothetical protein [Mesoflavibacter sp. CH_XMU1404-2]|uniref:hypothetical protein n=1 Tax=Mesoflavibacter sp. CH_XMU1404-2 TaxID=3107766 RepID=UPI00300AC5CB